MRRVRAYVRRRRPLVSARVLYATRLLGGRVGLIRGGWTPSHRRMVSALKTRIPKTLNPEPRTLNPEP